MLGEMELGLAGFQINRNHVIDDDASNQRIVVSKAYTEHIVHARDSLQPLKCLRVKDVYALILAAACK